MESLCDYSPVKSSPKSIERKMLTPRFQLSQTDNDVTIVIHAPYANIKDAMIDVEGTDFLFYSTPYYLRLNLPGEIVENDVSKGSYDCDKGDFTLKFSKVNKGEHFENLDMITTLLTPSKKKEKVKLVPTIEVISNPCAISNNFSKEENDVDESTLDKSGDQWYIEQKLPTENFEVPLQSPSYGFGNKISGALAAFDEIWIKEIIDLPFPDKTLPENRKELREKNEVESFKEDYYMLDLMTPEEYAINAMNYEAEWENLSPGEDVNFTEDEKDVLKELPNKEYLLDNSEVQIILFSMVDILFASCYNFRLTEGENNSESGWTITKLSSTLSWFQSFTNIHDVVLSCIRRSLCFPLVRNWNYAIKVFEDVKKVIKLGKKYIIKRFCEIHSIFNNSNEPRYILNQLYIKDYLIWLQQISNSKIDEISVLLESVNVKKEELGLNLEFIEEMYYTILKEDLLKDDDTYNIKNDLQKLFISDTPRKYNYTSEYTSDSDSDSDSSSTSTSSSADSSSDSSDSSESSESSGSYKSTYSHHICNSELDSDDEPN